MTDFNHYFIIIVLVSWIVGMVCFAVGVDQGKIAQLKIDTEISIQDSMSCDAKRKYILENSVDVSDSFMKKYIVQCKAPIAEATP